MISLTEQKCKHLKIRKHLNKSVSLNFVALSQFKSPELPKIRLKQSIFFHSPTLIKSGLSDILNFSSYLSISSHVPSLAAAAAPQHPG